MPGHKLGAGIPSEFLNELAKLDLTEIPGTDNLHKPTGAIREAQELAATAFGARKSFFLVNGSTVGLHAAIRSACQPGQRLIVGRDCHSSVIHGMLLAGVKPYFILPEYSGSFRINTGITPETVKKALESMPDAAGVLITRPNYYGICCDIESIAEIVHSYGKLLIVDEAHGAHLAFSPLLPASALKAGADICVQSAHKTLPAFTQGAYLHLGSDRVDEEKVGFFLDLLQTTSPSYVIMAFLDIAREMMQTSGEKALKVLLEHISSSSAELDGTGLRQLGQSDLTGLRLDSTRITVNVAGIGLTGYEAEKRLREQYRIQVEMSDLCNIVCISTIADNAESIGRLYKGLRDLSGNTGNICTGSSLGIGSTGSAVNTGSTVSNSCGTARWKNEQNRDRNDPGRSFPVFHGLSLPGEAADPADILYAKAESIPLEHAAGRISRGIISPYPPGIALVCPGEVLSREMVDFLLRTRQCGGVIHGIDENGNVVVI